MTTAPKYGIQFQPMDGQIHAGSLTQQEDRLVYSDHAPVTGQAIWATCEWVATHYGSATYEIKDAGGAGGFRVYVERIIPAVPPD